MRTRTLSLLSAVVVVATAVSCAAPQSSSGSATGSLNVYLYQKPKLFSPLEPANGPDQIVMSLIFDSMLGYNSQAQLEPHLAAAQPTVSPDATTFTFKLRPGMKWSDGTPFTSQDVLYTYNLLANPKSGSASSGSFAQIQGAAEVKNGSSATLSGLSAPDTDTVVIKTAAPGVGTLPILGTISILPQHILGSVPLDQIASNAFFNHPTVGMGPYNFVDYKTDQYVELKANSNFRSKVNISTVFLKTVTSDVATAQLGTGEMDLAQISPTDLPTVQGMKGVTVDSIDGTGYTRIAVNQTQSRFADPRVRQAMLYAIDRQKLVDSVLAGNGTVTNSSFRGEAAPKNLNTYQYNPAKAQQLLKDAGWNFAQPVTLEWVPGQRDRDVTATIVQSELQAAGMKVNLQQMQSSQLLDTYAKNSFDMVLYGGGNYVTDPWSTDPILACDQAYPTGGNIPHFCDPDFDKAVLKANATADQATRNQLYQQAATVENAKAAYLWLNNPKTLFAVTGRLKGAQLSSYLPNPFVNIQDWRLS
jgi:peptide/nickel transport system substrate-binding protein